MRFPRVRKTRTPTAFQRVYHYLSRQLSHALTTCNVQAQITYIYIYIYYILEAFRFGNGGCDATLPGCAKPLGNSNMLRTIACPSYGHKTANTIIWYNFYIFEYVPPFWFSLALSTMGHVPYVLLNCSGTCVNICLIKWCVFVRICLLCRGWSVLSFLLETCAEHVG